jgi:hypothetical protein
VTPNLPDATCLIALERSLHSDPEQSGGVFRLAGVAATADTIHGNRQVS